MDVRPATEEDILGIQWVARMTHQQVYSDLLNDQTRQRHFERRFSREALEETLADNAVGVYVAIARDSIAGVVTCGPTDTDGVGEVMTLHVDPGFWRRGFGSRLLAAAEGYLDEHGYKRVRAFVIAGNQPGNEFFGKRFERTGQWQSDEGVTYNVYRKAVEATAEANPDAPVGGSWI